MRCPRCGTLVAGDLDVCPACHAQLDVALPPEGAGERWCESCGSPVPAGLNSCPVCGMPVEGAFDEDDEAPVPIRTTLAVSEPEPQAQPEEKATGFISAIPPVPASGEQTAAGAAPSRSRLVLVAVLSSLLVVGGTALFITRPWDPEAYAIHATEDADTSMEGFPGERTHLTAQDFVEDAEWQRRLAAGSAEVDAYGPALEEASRQADELHDALSEFVATGYVDPAYDGLAQARRLQADLAAGLERLQALELDDEDGRRREELVLMEGYLAGEVDVLADAWLALEQAEVPSEAMLEVRSVLAGETSERGYAEWHELFANVYESSL